MVVQDLSSSGSHLLAAEPSMVLLIGASGAGKSTFALANFRETEIVSSDHCRAMISDDPDDQTVTASAFNLVRYISRQRIAAHRLVVIDATNIQYASRARMVRFARRNHVPISAVVLDFDFAVCAERNVARPRRVPTSVIRSQVSELKQTLVTILDEGFAQVIRFEAPEQLRDFELSRLPRSRGSG